MITAATAALDPEPMPGSGPGADADDTVTVSWADFKAWERQLTTCTHPIRLRGRIDVIDLATGELAPVYDTDTEHGGVLHVACGNRRESACPACSAVYKRDARQLVRAGLAGGKGVPRRSPRTRACSPPSPRPRSARSTPAGCAAKPYCRAAPAATPRPAAARTAGTSPARPGTSRRIPGSASRCAATATTMKPPCCSTPMRGICGAGSSPTCPGTWPAWPGSPRRDDAA